MTLVKPNYGSGKGLLSIRLNGVIYPDIEHMSVFKQQALHKALALELKYLIKLAPKLDNSTVLDPLIDALLKSCDKLTLLLQKQGAVPQ